MEKLLKNSKWVLPLALAVMFLYGSLYPSVKLGYRAFGIDTSSVPSIMLFAGMRFAICGCIMLASYARKGGKVSFPRSSALTSILLIALSAYVLQCCCTYIGISHMESSKAAILKQVGTLFIICFAFLFRKEDRFSPAKMIGGILGFASILVVNFKGASFSFTPYDLLVVIASFCTVAGTVVSKNAYDHHDPIYITAWSVLTGGVILLIMGVLGGGRFHRLEWDSLGLLAYMCFASCMGYTIWNHLLRHNDISRLNTIRFTEALFSAVCAWLLLGENIFRPAYLIALVLVCLGIWIGSRVQKLPAKKE